MSVNVRNVRWKTGCINFTEPSRKFSNISLSKQELEEGHGVAIAPGQTGISDGGVADVDALGHILK